MHIYSFRMQIYIYNTSIVYTIHPHKVLLISEDT
jgi:hypothetical protein